MTITIVTPERTVFNGEGTSVKLPGAAGRFEVLDGHAPIISTLTAGHIHVGGETDFDTEIASGFVEVAENHVLVCCEPPLAKPSAEQKGE